MLNVTLRTPWVKRMRVRFKKGKEEGKSAIHTMQENAEVRNLHRGAPECGHCTCVRTSGVCTCTGDDQKGIDQCVDLTKGGKA